MRLYEFEAKRVLAAEGIRIPKQYGLVRTLEELRKQSPAYPVMVKAQTLVGGRGKAGGVRRVESKKECVAAARKMFNTRIGAYPVERVLLEEALSFTGACYVGVTMNPATSNNLIMASAAGGVDIEEVARTEPEAILRIELPDNPDTLPAAPARKIARFLARKLGHGLQLEKALANLIKQLYATYQKYDCKVLEINPLLITPAGAIAADAKMVLDDNALYRQAGLRAKLGIKTKRHEVAEPTAREIRAADAGFPYVDLLPEEAPREAGKIYVGLVPGGAGYGIFSIDEVTNIGEKYCDSRIVPVNFMDSGGGPTREAVKEMFALLMEHPLVDLIITSRFGGISSCDIFIHGLVDCLRERAMADERIVPVYGRMVGTDLAAARAFLETARAETPQELAPLSMSVGNQSIMADVIREGLTQFLARHEEIA